MTCTNTIYHIYNITFNNCLKTTNKLYNNNFTKNNKVITKQPKFQKKKKNCLVDGRSRS